MVNPSRIMFGRGRHLPDYAPTLMSLIGSESRQLFKGSQVRLAAKIDVKRKFGIRLFFIGSSCGLSGHPDRTASYLCHHSAEFKQHLHSANFLLIGMGYWNYLRWERRRVPVEFKWESPVSGGHRRSLNK